MASAAVDLPILPALWGARITLFRQFVALLSELGFLLILVGLVESNSD
jgi:hypothetical protein